MSNGLKLFIVAALSTLIFAPTAAGAKEFFIATFATVPGFSNNGQCEAHGYGRGGCSIFGREGDCGGYSIHVGNDAHTQMISEYQRGEKITIRHLNANRSFGDVICTYN